MQQENNNLCKQFEIEVWLYISDELESERKALWDKHLAECPKCAMLLNSNRQVASFYKENMSEDLLDSSFDKIIEKATAKVSFFEKLKYSISGFGKSFVFGKIVFGSALITTAFIIILFSQHPNQIKQIAEKIKSGEDSTIITPIPEKASNSPIEGNTFAGDKKEEEWNNSVGDIQSGINRMEQEINEN